MGGSAEDDYKVPCPSLTLKRTFYFHHRIAHHPHRLLTQCLRRDCGGCCETGQLINGRVDTDGWEEEKGSRWVIHFSPTFFHLFIVSL